MAAIRDASVRTFTPDDVLRMIAAGILAEDEPIELVEGRLLVVSPQGPSHSYCVGALADRARAAYGAGFTVREEKPILLADGLPEPDVAVVRGSHADFAARHPELADIVLLVEVMVSSHDADRVKARSYARAGISILWLVDVPAKRVEVYAEPQPDGRYREARLLAGNDELALPGLATHWKANEFFR